MKKVFVKLRDAGTTFYDMSKDAKVSGNQVVEMEETPLVSEAIRTGRLQKVSESDAEKYLAETEEERQQAANGAAPADVLSALEEKYREMHNTAVKTFTDSLEEKHSEELASLKKQYDEQLETLKKEHAAYTDNVADDYQASSDKLKKEIQELSGTVESLTEANEALSKENEDLKKKSSTRK